MPTRYLRPGIRDSERLEALSSDAENLFYRLLVSVDDFGRMDARPLILKAACFPIKARATADKCMQWLAELVQAGLILTYVVDNKPYLQFSKWENKARSRTSKCPEHTDVSGPRTDVSDPRTCVSDPLTVLPGTGTGTGTGTSTIVPKNKNKSAQAPGEREHTLPPEAPKTPSRPENDFRDALSIEGFQQFWSLYPRKVQKLDAKKAWGKIKFTNDLLAEIMKGVAAGNESRDWLKDGGEFIPYPASWLNGRRWEDEVTPLIPKTDL